MNLDCRQFHWPSSGGHKRDIDIWNLVYTLYSLIYINQCSMDIIIMLRMRDLG